MKKISIALLGIVLGVVCYSQTTIFYQGFEGTCNDTWAYTTNAANVTSTTSPKVGAKSLKVGGNGTNATLTFNNISISGYTGVVLSFGLRTDQGFGSGPGFDSGENLIIEYSTNNGSTWVAAGTIGGGSDYAFDWVSTTVGFNNNACPPGTAADSPRCGSYSGTVGRCQNTACGSCTASSVANPVVISVPAGATQLTFRTRMSGTSFNRVDEFYYIDDVKLTTTSAISSVTWTGNISTDWFCAGNWSPSIVPTPSISAVFSTSSSSNNDIVLNPSTTAQCNNLSITGGSANNHSLKGEGDPTKVLRIFGNMTLNGQDGLDFSDGTNSTADGTIEIKGNWDNQIGEGEFKQGNSTVIFNGTTNQTISCITTGEIYYNLQINKTSGNVTLSTNNVEIGGHVADPSDPQSGVFTLTQGNMITGTYYVLVSNTAIAAVSGGSSSSFVDGNFRRMTAATGLYDFPTGEGTRYMRAGVRTTNSSANTVEVDAQNTGYGTYTPLESTLFDVSHTRWWDVSKISGSTAVSVRLYWIVPATDGITNVNDLVVAHYSNRDHSGTASTTQWWNRGRSAANSSALVTDGYVESSETMTTFSPFTISTITSTNPLPVELLSFHVACDNGMVKADWSTASETNNDHFELQGSENAGTYNILKTVSGHGNSNIMQQYHTEIANVNRYNYFRLAQVDMNGQTQYYTPTYLQCDPGNNALLAANNGHSIQLTLPAGVSSQLMVAITDMSGKTLISQPVFTSGNSQVTTIDPGTMAPGIYIIVLTDEVAGQTYYTKIFKN